ncbi:MAG: ribonuclease P protein component [Dermatophilaceae bacterium]
MLPAPHRLRSSEDFRSATRVHGTARSGGRLMVVHVNRHARGPNDAVRVGFVVPKAVGGAVVRNRTKRRLRGLMAARLGRIPAGADVVVRAGPAAADATSGQLARDLDRLLERAVAGARP